MSGTRKSEMIELLVEVRVLPRTHEIKLMIEEARAGRYHYVKRELVTKLDKLGYHVLAKRIKDGKFNVELNDKSMIRGYIKRKILIPIIRWLIRYFGK